MNESKTGATVAQRGIEINVEYIAKILLAKWWIIVLIGVFGASCGYICAELTKTPTYSSSISFVVSNKSVTAEENYSSSDINASITMANTYKYILSSRTLCSKVAKSATMYKGVSTGSVSGAISMSSIANTNIIIMKITTTSSAMSYDLAVLVIENFGEVIEQSGYTNSSLTICELPELAKTPDINTSAIRYAVVGAFAGAMLALIVVLMSNVLKDTVQSVEEIQSRLEMNVLGVISKITLKNRDTGEPMPLLIDERAMGFAFIETYKALRTKIENVSARKGYKVFVVSSAGENEGKTTIATNIAIALAQNGHSVLLIDADLRKPSVCKLLSLTNAKDNKGHGLADVIGENASFERAIRYIERRKIFLLASSGAVHEPAELLSQPQMERVIRTVRSEFDFVIIDTAPAGVVTDASIMTNYADALLMVVREDQTPINRIKTTLTDLSYGKAEIIGCVYNNVTSGSGKHLYGRYGRRRYGRYGYGRYGYGSYGGYGYGGYGYGYGYDTRAERDNDDSDDADT